MFMLAQSELSPELYNMASMDAATEGSETDLLRNVQESASIMDPWETVYPKAIKNLKEYGYVLDSKVAQAQVKELYQELRHGLCFDWVINYVVGKATDLYPFSRHFQFKGTSPFLEVFKDDSAITAELAILDGRLNDLANWVFLGYPEREVYKRLATFADTNDLGAALVYAERHASKSGQDPFVLPLITMARTGYLVLLMEMLSISIGVSKRTFWTDRIMSIRSGETPNMVIVSGGKFQAFAYGNLDQTLPKWHNLEGGIKRMGISERQQRKEFIRAIPDEMTFFRFFDSTVFVDETLFPTVSFFGSTGEEWTRWFTTNDFLEDLELPMDTPLKMRIKYDFPVREGITKTIKIKGKINCVVRDVEVVLDGQGIGETQVVFRGNATGFKISDADKKFPFAVFNTSKVAPKAESFEWLVD